MKYLRNVATIVIDKDTCTGCRMCVEVCPRGVIRMDGTAVVVGERDRCIECGACKQNCPSDAIRVDSGVGCAAAMINGLLRFGDADKGSCDCNRDSGCC